MRRARRCAVLLGLATSLSGSVLSVSAAWSGNADLAISNAVGKGPGLIGFASISLFLFYAVGVVVVVSAT